jgi:ankyrin repeat protein
MTAARTGVVGAVRALVRRGADLEAVEVVRGQTALMWALHEHHLEAARALIEAGASVSARSSGGYTPLMVVAREGNIDAARLLLDEGAEINAAAEADGTTPLLIATVRGHTDLAMFLLDRGADPNLAAAGYTPLHWAVGRWETLFTWDYPNVVTGEWGHFLGLREGRMELIRALLARGADVNARTRRSPPRFGSGGSGAFPGGRLVGVTPFYIAANVAEVELMRLLLAAGADPAIPNADETTALIAAAGATRRDDTSRIPEPRFLEATKLCHSLGLDVNARNSEGVTAMHAAAVAGFDSVVQYLFDQGGELSPKTKTGHTPLAWATSFEVAMTTFEHPSTAALLRKLGATE